MLLRREKHTPRQSSGASMSANNAWKRAQFGRVSSFKWEHKNKHINDWEEVHGEWRKRKCRPEGPVKKEHMGLFFLLLFSTWQCSSLRQNVKYIKPLCININFIMLLIEWGKLLKYLIIQLIKFNRILSLGTWYNNTERHLTSSSVQKVLLKSKNICIIKMLLLLLLSHFSRVWLCATPQMAAHQAPLSLGFSRQEHWSGLPFPSPVHESEKWKSSHSVVPDS